MIKSHLEIFGALKNAGILERMGSRLAAAEVAAIEGVLVESATSSRLLQVDLQWRPGRFLDWEGHERIGDY